MQADDGEGRWGAAFTMQLINADESMIKQNNSRIFRQGHVCISIIRMLTYEKRAAIRKYDGK